MQGSTFVTNSVAGVRNMIEELVLQPSRSTTTRPPYSIYTAVRLEERSSTELCLAEKSHYYFADVVEVY